MVLRSERVLVGLSFAWFVTARFWIAAASVGVLALLGQIARLFGPPWPVEPPAPKLQGEARLWALAFNLVFGWVGVGVLALIVMFETRTGAFAWFATAILGWDEAAPFATPLLGLIAIALPLVTIAAVPRQDRWPVLAAIQDRVRPASRRRGRR